MLTIILGIAMCLVFTWISVLVKSRGLKQLFSVIASTVFMLAIIFGLWYPFNGYEEWTLVEERTISSMLEGVESAQIKIEGIHDSLKEPVVKVYERKGVKSIWTFAIGTKETKYVISTATTMVEVKLN